MVEYFRLAIAIAGVACTCVAASAQSNTAPTKVAITPEHVLSINGKKVFPIGFTIPPPLDGKTPSGTPAFEELRSAGGLFIRTGPMRDEEADRKYSAWDAEWEDREKAYMTAVAKAGMYCVPWLKELSEIDPKHPGRENRLRQVVRLFKDDPALLVWKGADEPQWGERPVPSLVKALEIIHEEDLHHPVWIVQAPRGTVEELKPYDAAYDIGGVDVYPISYPPGVHLAATDTNREISVIGDYTRKMLRVTDNRKPIWLTLQIAFSGTSGRTHPQRFPTFAQQRFMTYQAIINGARGLVYFGGGLRSTLPESDLRYGWNWTYWNRVLRPVIEEVGDKGPLAEALCTANSKLPVKGNSSRIEFCVREVGRNLFVLACCRDPQNTAETQFSGLPNDVGTGEVLFESPRKVTAKNGTFTDWFAPYDVHVYKFVRH